MDAIFDLSWRIYPAAFLMAAGLIVAAGGLRREIDGILRPIRDPDKVLSFTRSLSGHQCQSTAAFVRTGPFQALLRELPRDFYAGTGVCCTTDEEVRSRRALSEIAGLNRYRTRSYRIRAEREFVHSHYNTGGPLKVVALLEDRYRTCGSPG